ncbi:MAG: nucleotidyltransferase family protein [bacterium]
MNPIFVTNWRQRIQKQMAEDKKKAQLMKEALPEAIKVLKQHGANRIILFGSLCYDEHFRKPSDIDLAVEGIAKQNFCRAYAELIMALDWPVDLKPLEELEKYFKERILQQGRILYEK